MGQQFQYPQLKKMTHNLAEKAGAPVQWLEWKELEEREQIIDKTANVVTK